MREACHGKPPQHASLDFESIVQKKLKYLIKVNKNPIKELPYLNF